MTKSATTGPNRIARRSFHPHTTTMLASFTPAFATQRASLRGRAVKPSPSRVARPRSRPRAAALRTSAKLYENILETIGSTPIIKINKLAPEGVTMYAKAEFFNPCSSVKDRCVKR
jgi:hypothetical protein